MLGVIQLRTSYPARKIPKGLIYRQGCILGLSMGRAGATCDSPSLQVKCMQKFRRYILPS
jgi:hypothetical protein